MVDWKDVGYLLEGTKKQISVYRAIEKLDILNTLAEFSPILTGTIPIGIDTKTSDIDIICEVFNLDDFKNLIIERYGFKEKFKIYINTDSEMPHLTANFIFDGFEFEIFAQAVPVNRQNAYLHMVIEHRLLSLLGANFKEQVIKLKNKGFKTEPSFAKLLNLQGDPYDSILKLHDAEDVYLIKLYNS